jgi:hypothetical protein
MWWKKVGCEAATPVGGKAALGVAVVCGVELQLIGHIPNAPELIEKGREVIKEGVEDIGNLF